MRPAAPNPLPEPSDRTRRLRDLLAGTAPVVAGLLVASLLLGLALGPAPIALRRIEMLDPDAMLAVRTRVAMLEDQVDPARLAVAVGFSTAREGIDRTLFRSSSGLDLLNLAGSGGSFHELQRYYDFVFDSRLEPRLLLLAVHPCWLSGRMLGKEQDRADGLVAVAAASLFPPWIVENRARMHVLMRTGLVAARAAFADRFGLGALGLTARAEADPWKTTLLYHVPHAPAAHLERQMAQWQGFGWFDERLFDTSSAESAVWVHLLRRAEGFAKQTVVVLMPESAALRARVPARAEQTLRALASESAVPLRVLDLRAALPDSMLYDHVHLNAAGREQFSRLLGDRVAALLASGR